MGWNTVSSRPTIRCRMTVWVNQAGVVPVWSCRAEHDETRLDGRLCMVTSRSARRWVFPKGLIDPGHTPGAAALIEAWEEAGLVGTLDGEPVGNYVYEKYSTP